MRKPYKRYKRGLVKHTQLYEWFQCCEAWATLKPGPRALYIELKRLFNGSNNGNIFLSHRKAAKAINVGRDTVGGYFAVLVDRGFIVVTRGHCLGPDGIGQSATYALAEEFLDGLTISKVFMCWKMQGPRKKNRHSLAGKTDIGCLKKPLLKGQMLENTATIEGKPLQTVLENPAIYTYDHDHVQNRDDPNLEFQSGENGFFDDDPKVRNQPPDSQYKHDAREQVILSAIESLNKEGSTSQARPGTISSVTGLGNTTVYMLIDELVAKGQIIQEPDGQLHSNLRDSLTSALVGRN